MRKCKECKSYRSGCCFYVKTPAKYNEFTGQKIVWIEYLNRSNNMNGKCEYFQYKWYIYCIKVIWLFISKHLTEQKSI